MFDNYRTISTRVYGKDLQISIGESKDKNKGRERERDRERKRSKTSENGDSLVLRTSI